MFASPIKWVRLQSMSELVKFSYRTTEYATPFTMARNNGQIAFTDRRGTVFVTPYRPEIDKILEKNNYREGDLWVPFSNGEERPTAYKWLVQIAEEECQAANAEMAHKVAMVKGIKEVTWNQEKVEKVWIKQVLGGPYNDGEATYFELYSLSSEDNVGTYILINEKTILLCDEYGRTFLVKVKTVINDLVNALIEAGYCRTANPERYISGMN